MRLIYFIPLLSTVGGQERTLTDKANYLNRKGHEVMFVTYEHEGPLAYPLDEGVRHQDLACHYFSLYRYPVYRRLFITMELKRRFRQQMKDVISSFHPDVIVVAIPNTENFLNDIIKVAGRIPVVIESHLAHGYIVANRGFTEKWLYYVYNPMRAIRKARLLVALTEGDAAYWRQYVKEVRVIPNPVTLYPTSLPSPVDSRHSPRIICVGRLTPQKRFDRMIDAFALIADKYPEWRVDIFGEGEVHKELQQQIEEKHLTDRIRLLPPTKDIYAEYQRSKFFVLSSDFEGFGLVIVEAMACGIPVVCTNCPYGPSEIIADGETGLLAKLDVQDLANKMEWMITHDDERRQMGIHAHAAAARYQQESVIPQWEQAYQSVIEG